MAFTRSVGFSSASMSCAQFVCTLMIPTVGVGKHAARTVSKAVSIPVTRTARICDRVCNNTRDHFGRIGEWTAPCPPPAMTECRRKPHSAPATSIATSYLEPVRPGVNACNVSSSMGSRPSCLRQSEKSDRIHKECYGTRATV